MPQDAMTTTRAEGSTARWTRSGYPVCGMSATRIAPASPKLMSQSSSVERLMSTTRATGARYHSHRSRYCGTSYIRLVNSGLIDRKSTANNHLFGFQLIQPGEVAPAHRHTMTAFRFVLCGQGAFTNVDGEKIICNRAISFTHPNGRGMNMKTKGVRRCLGDGLDVPLIETLQVVSVE